MAKSSTRNCRRAIKEIWTVFSLGNKHHRIFNSRFFMDISSLYKITTAGFNVNHAVFFGYPHIQGWQISLDRSRVSG
ncbi:MAG: hypothetical protein QGG48_08090, partial [Desulfatiglandales bacterium]|nr:hypothetical protein [Desulfatiglandales bacterium]